MMATIKDLDFLLEIIHQSGVVNGRKRLQKTVCVLKYRDKIPLSFVFVPYYYGPYSETLADMIRALVGAGYVNEEPVEVAIGIFQYNYSLTKQGLQRIEEPRKISDAQVKALRELVADINKMNLDDLVRLSKTLELIQKPVTA